MSSTDRQNRLLLAEDWKKIYQSFKNAEFKSYDFDNLRRTMIEYIRQNYPEDFNDYIESSEYLALIDLIAFLGQNISFRIDLNARENFIELAERRESVLRLARLLSYNPRRNRAGNGLLKFNSVSTTEPIFDSNGQNLSGKTIVWNDSINPNWFEQFTKVLNAALPNDSQFGKPINFASVSGVPTEQYRFNSVVDGVPIFTFSKSVNNINLKFEIVSTGLENGTIVEESPNPFSQVGFVYRDNGQGPGSNTTGFFMHFRQGNLQRGDFVVDSPVPNQKIDIDVTDINQTDVWLYSLDSNGRETELWTKVDAVEGNNIVYNSLNKKIRNIYSVLTRVDDRISLVFSDGVFGNLPKGRYRAYYRTSANKDYTIFPANITSVNVRIPYISKTGKVEYITVAMSLKVAVDNASSAESTESIKNNAPSTYYTQNRLITGEDYNIGPLGISQDIIKTKSVSRTASGISRYFDILDATGKYSQTTLFGTDGVLYKEYEDKKTNFKFVTRTDVEQIIQNTIVPILQEKSVRNYYLDKFPNQDYTELNISWSQESKDTNRSTGVFKDSAVVALELQTGIKNTNTTYLQVGSFTSSPMKFLEPGAMVKFVAPAGKRFSAKNEIINDTDVPGSKKYIWTKMVSVSGDGTLVSNGVGPIVFNDVIPTGAILQFVKPKFSRDIEQSVKGQMLDQIFAYKTFGLRYDIQNREWRVIIDNNLNLFNDFDLSQSGDSSDQQIDSSWILLFETNGISYNVSYRTLRYVFESDAELRFYFDGSRKIYDSKTGKIIRDKIKVLNINTKPGQLTAYTTDFDWEVASEFKDPAGYVDSKKLEIVFFDSDEDGVIDNPDIFNEIVGTNFTIFTKKLIKNGSQFEVYVNEEEERIFLYNPSKNITHYQTGDVIYYANDDVFKIVDRESNRYVETFVYTAYNGRAGLKFQFVHATDDSRRIDPSSTNIIDTYILTRQYDTAFRQYLQTPGSAKPLPPSSDSLFLSFGNEINKVKSISDEIIYHPVKYKSLFGAKSDLDMQAVFKVVKNPSRVVSDNEIKSRVISSINKFFALDNWDFGETFYFSELAAFITKDLAPDVASIVIVPRAATSSFGSLFEVRSEADEIFISSATVDDVEIITSNTADRLQAQGAIVNSTGTTNAGIQSAQGIRISNNTGGFTY